MAYATFGAKIIAGIGKLPATIMDRGIQIRMKRKTRLDSVEKFRRPQKAACHTLRRKLRRWADDNQAAVAGATPSGPPCLGDRAADVWEALFQIAKVIGPDWEKRAVDAARLLGCREEDRDEDDYGVDLLEDIRVITVDKGYDKVTSLWHCHELGELEGRPWATFSHRQLISLFDLNKLLPDY